MGVFDHAARFAAQADPGAVLHRLLASEGRPFAFREWLDTRTFPMPGGPDRTADLVAAMDDPAGVPWLVVLEFQAQHDEGKLDVTLQEVAALRASARHGADRQGRYRAVAGLVYLVGECPASLLDMTLPSGAGTRHQALVWNVASDDAASTLEKVAAGELSWGMLFWVPLMAGGGDVTLIERWKEVVTATVTDERRRGELAGIARIFAGLARRGQQWGQIMGKIQWTESEVVNEWMDEAQLREARANLVRIVKRRLSDPVPAEVLETINAQPELDLLHDWIDEAVTAKTIADFVAVLRR